jgi:hypothetical protein
MDLSPAGTRCFLFSRDAAAEAFPGIAHWRVILAVLATVRPEERWEGCLVFEVDPPPADPGSSCVCVSGPGAQEASDRLIEALRVAGVPTQGTLVGEVEPIGAPVEASNRSWS